MTLKKILALQPFHKIQDSHVEGFVLEEMLLVSKRQSIIEWLTFLDSVFCVLIVLPCVNVTLIVKYLLSLSRISFKAAPLDTSFWEACLRHSKGHTHLCGEEVVKWRVLS